MYNYSDDGPCICADRGHSMERSREFDEIEDDASCMKDGVSYMN